MKKYDFFYGWNNEKDSTNTFGWAVSEEKNVGELERYTLNFNAYKGKECPGEKNNEK